MALCPVHATVLWFDGSCPPCVFAARDAARAALAPATSTCCGLPLTDDTCSGCGIEHSEPCSACGQRGLHASGCPTLAVAEAVGC